MLGFYFVLFFAMTCLWTELSFPIPNLFFSALRDTGILFSKRWINQQPVPHDCLNVCCLIAYYLILHWLDVVIAMMSRIQKQFSGHTFHIMRILCGLYEIYVYA